MSTAALRQVEVRATVQPFRAGGRIRTALLVCGILSSLLYAAMLVFVPLGWEGYDSASQTVSELSAIGAPTRSLWVSLGLVWTTLYAAFGWGVWLTAGGNRRLRLVGGVLIFAAVFGLFWPPMHSREVLAAGGGTSTDSLHLVWTAVNGAFTLLAMAFGAAALGKRFRHYSIATMVILLAAGSMTGTYASRMEANLPTPGVGAWERTNIGVWLLWIVVLAAALLRPRRDAFEGHGAALRRWLLACGLVGAMLYPLADIYAAMRYPGFSYRDQAVSELFALGAPTSAIVVPLFSLSSTLLLFFAGGIWMSANGRRWVRLMAVMMALNTTDALVLWNFFPMHMRGSQPSFTDLMHGLLAIDPFLLAAVVLGAVAFRGWFRVYTVTTIVFTSVLAIIGFSYVSAVTANQPTPWMGAIERAAQYATNLWYSVLAVCLLRERGVASRRGAAASNRFEHLTPAWRQRHEHDRHDP